MPTTAKEKRSVPVARSALRVWHPRCKITTNTSCALQHGALHARSLQLDAEILHQDFAQALKLDCATGAPLGAALL